MARALGLSRAGWLVVALAAACGTDTIDLLPTGAGGSAPAAAGATGGGSELGGSANVSGTSGADTSGSGSSGSGSSGASAGAGGSNLGGGGTGGCSGFGCGGFGSNDGFGGDDGECNEIFCPCGPQGRCGYGLKCNLRLAMCTPKCESALECGGEGLLCEDDSCATCSEDEQCKQFGGFGRRVCVDDRCEECREQSDCPDDSPMCIARRCIQCLTNEDCPSKSCDKARGRCDK